MRMVVFLALRTFSMSFTSWPCAWTIRIFFFSHVEFKIPTFLNHSQPPNFMAEQYQGVKFRVEFQEERAPQDPRLNELMGWYNLSREYNLSPIIDGTCAGNLSFRTNNGFIITGSQIGLDRLTEDCFVHILECDLDEGLIRAIGTRNPSSETFMHFLLYQQRPDVNAVFHGHSPEILQANSRLTPKIPETEQEVPYGTI
jgi:hypothetical protein